MSYAIKQGYVERDEPAYFLDDATGTTYQPDVYWYAFGVAIELGASGIVDLGCGYAGKLAALHQQRPDWTFTGIDHGLNIDNCAAHYSWGEWETIDFENPHSYDATDRVIVCADVIEHLKDPRPLLAGIKASGAEAAVLSTPERDLTYGEAHNGPPPNPCHIREWNLEEFGTFLRGEGFHVAHLGLTRGDDAGLGDKTILARVA